MDVVIATADSDQDFDLPNGAWGLEVVPAIPGAQLVALSPTHEPSAVWEWIDLDDQEPALRSSLAHYVSGAEFYRQSRIEESYAEFESALRFATDHGDAEFIAQAGYMVSVLQRRLGRYDDAASLLESLLARGRPEYFRPSLFYALGSTLHEGGDPEAGKSALRAAVELAHVNTDGYVNVTATRQLCYVVHRHEGPAAALPCYKELRDQPALQSYPTIEATVLNAQASAMEDLGRFDEAIDLFAQAITAHQAIGNKRSVANARYNLANTQKQMGYYLQALANYLQAFSYFQAADWRSQRQAVVGSIADVYRMLGDPVLAEAWFRYGLTMHWSDDVDAGTQSARIGLANLYIQEGELNEAESVLGTMSAPLHLDLDLRRNFAMTALASEGGRLADFDLASVCASARSSGDVDFVAQCRYWEASKALVTAEYDKVGTTLEGTDLSTMPADMVLALETLGTRATLQAGRFEQARARVDDLIDGLFMLASQMPSWHVFNFNQLHAEIWDLAMLSVWQDPLMTENQKSRRLWELDRRRRQLVLRGFERDSAYMAASDLSLDEVNGWSQTLLEGKQIPFEISARLLEIDVATPVSGLPMPMANTGLPSTPTVSYWLGETLSIGIAADAHSVVAVEIPSRSRIDQLTEDALDALRGGRSQSSQWTRLEKAVWRPMIPFLPSSGALNIAPDGVLATIPFESFNLENESVLQRFELAYSHGAFEEDSIPWRGSPDEAVTIFARPDYRGQRPDLQQALGEVEIAGEVFSSVNSLTGADATRAALLSRATNGQAPSILHLAAHGRWDAKYPAHSGIWMSEPDGFVSVRELATTSWDTQLTVLTACSTNVRNGKLTNGPVQSVALAAMVAGARTVIATLWDVPDTAALDFSKFFYTELAKGQTVREATRNAKISMKDSVFWSAPVYWAAFQPWVR